MKKLSTVFYLLAALLAALTLLFDVPLLVVAIAFLLGYTLANEGR